MVANILKVEESVNISLTLSCQKGDAMRCGYQVRPSNVGLGAEIGPRPFNIACPVLAGEPSPP